MAKNFEQRKPPLLTRNSARFSFVFGCCVCISLFTTAYSEATPPQQDDISAFLGALGYPQESFDLLVSWNESGRCGGEGLIRGFRLRAKSDGTAFDVYSLADRILNQKELETLGVATKQWDIPPIGIPAAKSGSPKRPAPKRLTAPPGIRYGMEPQAAVYLPEIDAAKLRDEDEKRLGDPEKDLPRIGVFQDLPQTVELCAGLSSHGTWRVLPDGGYLWNVAINAPGALGQRVQFSSLTLPEGGEVFIYSRDERQEAFGPFNAIPPGESEFWSPTCFSQNVIAECYLPPEAEPAQVCLQIPRIAHIYKSSVEASLEKAGACNIDVTCYPDWAETALGIGGLGVISSPNVLFCTCTLIADLDNCSDIPYVLTANHCVRDQTGSRGASFLEFYWFFQTNACNGSAPALASVPRTTGGAEYLAGATGTGFDGGGNDFTLLRLYNEPPENVTRVGWAATPPPIGTAVTAIHHPHGEFKRISFGHMTDEYNVYSNLYHQVLWDNGTTEPGSSGCPLLITATQQIIGQLWGGHASCTNPTAPDYFGRFDVTYTIIRDFLTPPDVQFAEQAYETSENAGVLNLPVTLTQPARENGATVGITLVLGTAQQEDLSLEHLSLTFSPGQTQTMLPVNIRQDTFSEAAETFTLTLTDPSCMLLGQLSSVIITILDDDLDTDGDGLSDYDEIHGTFGYISDPNLIDTDGDTISDSDEVKGTRGYITNPGNRDTDGDGLTDIDEFRMHLNPTDPADRALVSSMVIPWFSPGAP